jgi:uncharacterized protein (UPF0212 family)
MAFSKSQPVYVVVPPKLDLNGVQEITAKTLGMLGCPNCHSGHDIRFVQQQVILFDRALEGKAFNGH